MWARVLARLLIRCSAAASPGTFCHAADTRSLIMPFNVLRLTYVHHRSWRCGCTLTRTRRCMLTRPSSCSARPSAASAALTSEPTMTGAGRARMIWGWAISRRGSSCCRLNISRLDPQQHLVSAAQPAAIRSRRLLLYGTCTVHCCLTTHQAIVCVSCLQDGVREQCSSAGSSSVVRPAGAQRCAVLLQRA